ncbi:hypothetical protein ACLGL1_06105 [Peptococcus simiae]|uniref:hypothetical protein n=1 Tax=Peptococcus simiae TaxID=1643805 RepID=UPI00397F4071
MLKQDAERIQSLKDRCNHCVCQYCGSPLLLKKISFISSPDARVEIFCSNCDKIEYGVESEIYKIAKLYVEETGFNHYKEFDISLQSKRMNIAKVAQIITWTTKSLGFLSNKGFTVTPAALENIVGSCKKFTDADFQAKPEPRDNDE